MGESASKQAVAAPATPLATVAEVIACVASAVAVLIGSGVLLGWAVGCDWMKGAGAGIAPVAPTTAGAVILAGLSLGLAIRPTPWRRRVSRAFAAPILVAGVVVLALHVGGHDLLGIELPRVHGAPVRPSGASAFGQVFVGAALLAIDVGAGWWFAPAELLAIGAAMLGWFVLEGALYGTAEVYRLSRPPATTMSIHAAIALFVLSIGIISARPRSGAMSILTSQRTGGRAARRMLPVTLAIPVFGYLGVVAQRAGLYSAPGAALVGDVAGMVASIAITVAVGRSLERAHEEIEATNRKLEKAEATFRGVVQIAGDAIVAIDEGQRVVLYNRAAEEVFGWSREEAIGRPVEDLIPQRFHGAHHHWVEDFGRGPVEARRLSEGRPTVRGLRKSGEEFPAEASISKLAVGGSKLFTVVLRDVTEREREAHRQKLLAQAGADLASTLDRRAILDHVARLAVAGAVDVCIVDLLEAEGQPSALKATSSDPAQAEACAGIEKRGGSGFARSLGERRRPIQMSEIPANYLESVASDAEQLEALRSLGLGSAIVMPIVAGERLLGAIFGGSRRTHRYGASDALLVEELARRLALALENARLYEAARLATEARDKVLGVVAHDLRNPVSAIVMHASLMRRRERDRDKIRAGIDSIERGAHGALRLIQDLLDVRRIESGRLSVECRATPVADVVREAVEVAQRPARDAGLALDVEVADALPDVWADRDRLLQVLGNLLGNAFKFTERGGRVVLGAAPKGEEVVFRVSDTGIGIDPDQLPHLFDPFWQAKTGGDPRGAGLGLPIVKGIVESHGGHLSVESEPRRGSMFSFALPTATHVAAARQGAGCAAPG